MLAKDARLEADGSRLVTDEALGDLREHALAEYPRECVGAIMPSGQYRRLVNVSTDPLSSAWPSGQEMESLLKDGIRALCHSHPDGPDVPSEQDMRAQEALAVPFIIISTDGQASLPAFAWGDDLVPMPLVGRPFRHGVTDCYEIIRTYYRQERGVLLTNYPRNWEWWSEDTPGEKNFYSRYFQDEGFRVIKPSDIQVGDVWLAAVRSASPNHAGVYLGDGLMIHHASSRLPHDASRLSRREPVAKWAPFITHWLRRD